MSYSLSLFLSLSLSVARHKVQPATTAAIQEGFKGSKSNLSKRQKGVSRVCDTPRWFERTLFSIYV
jgi:hypothetical protein